MGAGLLFSAVLISTNAFAAEKPESAKAVSHEINPIDKINKEDGVALQRHLPFYFVYGEPLSKLQISFKTPIVRKLSFYFAYTQAMFWSLSEQSKPFRDLTYNPELFYRWANKHWGILESVDFGLFSHNSNGKKDFDSRSYDKQYLRFNFAREGRRWVTRFSTEFAYLNHFDGTNRDIQNYIGPLALSISFIQLFDAYIDKSEVSLKASPGGKFAGEWGRGGYQVSWAFRLGKIDIVPAFYLQYYHGFAETLLNYNEDVDEFRGGLIF